MSAKTHFSFMTVLLFFVVPRLCSAAEVSAEKPVTAYAKLHHGKRQPAHGFWPLALEQLKSQHKARWQPGQAFSDWQQQGRQLLRQSYLWQQPLPDINAKLLLSLDQGSYLRELWQLQLLTTEPQLVWLLKPKTASASKPQLLCCYYMTTALSFVLAKTSG